MARLPVPGSDDGEWGNILNEYLQTSLNSDGTIKDNSVSAASITDSTIPKSKLTSAVQTSLDLADTATVPTGGTTGQLLAKASGTNYDTEWIDAESGTSVVTGTGNPNGRTARNAIAEVITAGVHSPSAGSGPEYTVTWDEPDGAFGPVDITINIKDDDTSAVQAKYNAAFGSGNWTSSYTFSNGWQRVIFQGSLANRDIRPTAISTNRPDSTAPYKFPDANGGYVLAEVRRFGGAAVTATTQPAGTFYLDTDTGDLWWAVNSSGSWRQINERDLSDGLDNEPGWMHPSYDPSFLVDALVNNWSFGTTAFGFKRQGGIVGISGVVNGNDATNGKFFQLPEWAWPDQDQHITAMITGLDPNSTTVPNLGGRLPVLIGVDKWNEPYGPGGMFLLPGFAPTITDLKAERSGNLELWISCMWHCQRPGGQIGLPPYDGFTG